MITNETLALFGGRPVRDTPLPPYNTIGAAEKDAVMEVLDAGYEDNLLLAADFSQSRQLKTNWGHGFSTVLMQFVPKLKYAGVDDATLHKILVDNPRRLLAFVPRAA